MTGTDGRQVVEMYLQEVHEHTFSPLDPDDWQPFGSPVTKRIEYGHGDTEDRIFILMVRYEDSPYA